MSPWTKGKAGGTGHGRLTPRRRGLMGRWVVPQPQEQPWGSSRCPAPVRRKPKWQPGQIPAPTFPGITRHSHPRTSSPVDSLVTRVAKSHRQDEKPTGFLTKQLCPAKPRESAFKKHRPHRGTAEIFLRRFLPTLLPAKPPSSGETACSQPLPRATSSNEPEPPWFISEFS